MAGNDEQFGPERASTPVGQYYLLDKIAQGGMAEIYKGLAYDLHGIKRTVVIKKILPSISSDPEFVNMLINEAKIAVMLSHGNIAHIYDLGKVGDDYFMVMEYVDGKSLSQIHKRSLKMGHLIPVEYVCYFISEVANGLNYMHRRSDEQGRNLGIIHRDISPQNVIVSYSGTVKIIDFGIAKAAIQMNITESGVLKGKFAYMSPEQAKGEPIDHRSDIFSLGVILHELLTGKRLFKGKNKKETLQNVRRAKVLPPSSVRTDLPPGIDKIVMKALSVDPRQRYMWASEFRDELIKFIYTTYPDFQPSTITDYIRNIFEDEFSEREDTDEDAKTPFLIIDHTQSAILPEKQEVTGLTKIPPQLKDFMLEEETSHEDVKLVDEEISEKGEDKKKSKGKKKRISPLRFFKREWKTLTAALLSIITILGLTAAYGIYKGHINLPRFAQTLAPKTKLIINVTPEDAKVVLGGDELVGEPPYTVKGIRPGDHYRLIIERDGYQPYLSSITVNKGKKKKLDISLKPALPKYGTVKISSDPQGANIFLNEKNTNLKTPAELESIEPNKYHTIGLFLKGHEYWSRDILLKPEEKKSFKADLKIAFGTLEVISSPPGATVVVDGEKTGKTPFKMEKVEPDKVFDVHVSKKGFNEWSQKAQVKAGQTLTLRPRLSRTEEYLVPDFLRELKKPSKKEPEIKTPQNFLPPAPAD